MICNYHFNNFMDIAKVKFNVACFLVELGFNFASFKAKW